MWVSDLSEDEKFCEIPAVRHKWVSDLSEDLLYCTQSYITTFEKCDVAFRTVYRVDAS